MQIMIATDIHGSLYWAQKVKQQYDVVQPDVLVLLGDIYNHGPRNPLPTEYNPMQVAEVFNGICNKVIAVQGNCDSAVDQMISKFSILPHNIFVLGGRKIFFTHGHIYNKDTLPNLAEGDVLFYGHFHKNQITNNNGVICVNVGSCSLPFDGHHSFALLNEQGITLSSFDGEILAQHQF